MFTNHNLNIKPAFPVDGDGYEYNQRQDDDNYFEQPGKLFRLQSDDAKERIFTNTANAMDGVSEDVKHRHIRHCYKVDPEYGKGVAKALEIDINDVDLEGTNDETTRILIVLKIRLRRAF